MTALPFLVTSNISVWKQARRLGMAVPGFSDVFEGFNISPALQVVKHLQQAGMAKTRNPSSPTENNSRFQLRSR